MGAKQILRNKIAQFLFQLGLTIPARRCHGRLSIATFHRVLPDADRQNYPFPGLVVTPEELDAFLGYFAEHFDCGSLAIQHERYLRGEVVSRPLLALTFDDAQHDNYSYARSLLAQHNVKATFFAPAAAIVKQELLWHDRLGFSILALFGKSGGGHEHLQQILARAGLSESGPRTLIGNIAQGAKELALEERLRLVDELADACDMEQFPEFARPMTFDELAELASDGHEIGSHSMTHCMMPECDDNMLNYEMAESRRVLQTRLGQPVESFCYPNGDSDARTARAAEMAGYRRAVTTSWGSNGKKTNRFLLCRHDIVSDHVRAESGIFAPSLLAFRMSGYYPGLA